MHDTIGCYLDLDKGQISYAKNGKVAFIMILIMMTVKVCGELLCFFFPPPGNDLGLAFEVPQSLTNQPFFASCVLKVSVENSLNCGGFWKQTKLCQICTTQIVLFPHLSARMQS